MQFFLILSTYFSIFLLLSPFLVSRQKQIKTVLCPALFGTLHVRYSYASAMWYPFERWSYIGPTYIFKFSVFGFIFSFLFAILSLACFCDLATLFSSTRFPVIRWKRNMSSICKPLSQIYIHMNSLTLARNAFFYTFVSE